ncbi:MAG: dihydroorotate dehydrogenase [Thermodesulfobacteriaceae bacterium]|nr:dihydroorotate dehydrogenase [Thermodesulfobacteriaceae bacterium]
MKEFFLNLGNLKLNTPLMLSSGTWGWGENLSKFLSLAEIKYSIGALVTKGVSLEPKEGNPPPRIAETPCGLINSIGLENPGIKEFKAKYLPPIKLYEIPVIVNLFGEKIEDFVGLAEELKEEVSGIELNISCPNVEKGGILFSDNPKLVKDLVREVRKIWNSFLAVKLSPVGPVFEVAKSCERAESDALVVANTYPALTVLSFKPLKILKGGLSGPAIKPLTLRLVWELSQRVGLPIIGCGGIITGKDALEYLICGAKAVQIGTANLINPKSVAEIMEELEKLLKTYGLSY